MEGKELMRDDLTNEELGQKILEVSGFAAVYPEHKHRIVQALQARGMLVGMTGTSPLWHLKRILDVYICMYILYGCMHAAA